MRDPTNIFPQRRNIAVIGIPYKTCRKPMILGASISLEIQKIHAARLPYKTCRKCMVPLTKSFPHRRKILWLEYLIKPVENL